LHNLTDRGATPAKVPTSDSGVHAPGYHTNVEKICYLSQAAAADFFPDWFTLLPSQYPNENWSPRRFCGSLAFMLPFPFLLLVLYRDEDDGGRSTYLKIRSGQG
jgi:hypothetical protein